MADNERDIVDQKLALTSRVTWNFTDAWNTVNKLNLLKINSNDY